MSNSNPPSDLKSRAYKAVVRHPGRSAAEVAAVVGAHTESVRRALKELADDGTLYERRNTRHGNLRIEYHLGVAAAWERFCFKR